MADKAMADTFPRCVRKDGNGLLDSDEVLDVLLQMGYNREQINVEETMTEIDEDGNGEVDIDEFRKWFFVQDTSAQEHLTVVYYQSGPGERAETTLFELPLLFVDGVVTTDTLIWCACFTPVAPIRVRLVRCKHNRMDGMDEWGELSHVRGGQVDSAPAERLQAGNIHPPNDHVYAAAAAAASGQQYLLEMAWAHLHSHCIPPS